MQSSMGFIRSALNVLGIRGTIGGVVVFLFLTIAIVLITKRIKKKRKYRFSLQWQAPNPRRYILSER